MRYKVRVIERDGRISFPVCESWRATQQLLRQARWRGAEVKVEPLRVDERMSMRRALRVERHGALHKAILREVVRPERELGFFG